MAIYGNMHHIHLCFHIFSETWGGLSDLLRKRQEAADRDMFRYVEEKAGEGSGLVVWLEVKTMNHRKTTGKP